MTRRRRPIGMVVGGAVLATLVIAATLIGISLWRSANNSDDSEMHARAAVQAGATRYRAAVVAALEHGPVSGAELLALRPPVGATGKVAPGSDPAVGLVGLASGHGRVAITFQAIAHYSGAFGGGDVSRCYRIDVYGPRSERHQSMNPIACSQLGPAVSTGTVVRLAP